MHVAFFCAKYPYPAPRNNYPCGGSIHAACSLAEELSNLGHEISVFTTSANGEEFEQQRGVKINRYQSLLRLGSSNISLGPLLKPKNEGFDLVHVHYDIPPAPLFGVMAGKKWRCPIVLTYHGDWISDFGGPLRRASVVLSNSILANMVLDPVDVIISPSRTYVETSKTLTKFREKTYVIPNGIDLDDFDHNIDKEQARAIFNISTDVKVVLYHGYLYPHKGPDIIIKAMKEINKRIPDCLLVCAGVGPMLHEIENIAMDQGIGRSVTFLGMVPSALRKYLYAMSDVFVLPSQRDCFPLVILEAMASGLPIVASRIGGVPDMIHENSNGILVEKNDIDGFSRSVIRLLEDERSRRAMGQASADKIHRYSWHIVAEETEALYGRVVRRDNGVP